MHLGIYQAYSLSRSYLNLTDVKVARPCRTVLSLLKCFTHCFCIVKKNGSSLEFHVRKNVYILRAGGDEMIASCC